MRRRQTGDELFASRRRAVNLWLGGAIIVAAVAVAVTLMVIARRHAPASGFFTDSDRSAGIFGVLGTSFAVLLAFVIFLAFESYGNAKDKAGTEAVAVTGLFGTARVFSPSARDQLRGELICYGRSVVADEWRTMKDGRASPLVDGWLADLDTTAERLDISGEKQAAGFGAWLEQSASRREGRRGRLAEAAPFVPPPLWMVLILGAGLVLGYMCLYADRREPWPVQAVMIGAVTAVVVSGLLMVRFFDRPYENGSGSIRPVEMVKTLKFIDVEQRAEHQRVAVPCDERGRPSPK
jgi:Protein of unknown function (DUF4239)